VAYADRSPVCPSVATSQASIIKVAKLTRTKPYDISLETLVY